MRFDSQQINEYVWQIVMFQDLSPSTASPWAGAAF
jgi:hypothetical protein